MEKKKESHPRELQLYIRNWCVAFLFGQLYLFRFYSVASMKASIYVRDRNYCQMIYIYI